MKGVAVYVLFSFLISNITFNYSLLQADCQGVVKFLDSTDGEGEGRQPTQPDKDPEFKVEIKSYSINRACQSMVSAVDNLETFSEDNSEILTPPPE
jgi:hypothetical protein